MNAEIKQKWVDALRSGEYEQGADYLRANGKYCCLGVLLEVTNCRINEFAYAPTKSQCKKLGIPYWSGLSTQDKTITEILANKNDIGISFIKIANYIEKNL